MTRADRLAELIKEEISDIIRRRVSDPRIGFVSITDVALSPDLKEAKVYISVFGDENKKKEAMDGLGSATGFIRSELAHILKIRTMPHIRFIRDDSIERGSKVLEIISKLEHEERVQKNRKGHKKR